MRRTAADPRPCRHPCPREYGLAGVGHQFRPPSPCWSRQDRSGPGSILSRPTRRWWPKLVADPGQAVFARTWVPARPRVGSRTAHLPAGAGPVSAQVEGDEVAALGREVVGGAFALLVPGDVAEHGSAIVGVVVADAPVVVDVELHAADGAGLVQQPAQRADRGDRAVDEHQRPVGPLADPGAGDEGVVADAEPPQGGAAAGAGRVDGAAVDEQGEVLAHAAHRGAHRGVPAPLPDGTVTIGQWGRDASMSPSVRSVRQNLDLLVDRGTVNPTCANGSTPRWGFGVGNNAFVPRTGIGQRADGALVFVNSPVTSVCSLGRLLHQAGAVRGMELDINNDLSIGYYYTHDGGTVLGHVTRDNQSKGPTHYFTAQSRDFIAFYLR